MSHSTIKKGDKGNEVKLCQELLNDKGYSVSVDSDFGPSTDKQVRQFQKDNGLGADGVVGSKTWNALEKADISLPIDFQRFVDLFPEVSKQKYKLSGAQCPSNPPGISLKRIGYATNNCVLFTSWIISAAFDGVSFTKDQWSQWMVSSTVPNPLPVPGYGPKVCLEWGIATTAPGEGVYLIQYFTKTGGHSMLVVDHDPETDKILTLESNSAFKLNGVGWADIGNLRDVPNPGSRKKWVKKVKQTWKSRFGDKVALHVVRLRVDPESIKKFLDS
jgi:hypothetical protein